MRNHKLFLKLILHNETRCRPLKWSWKILNDLDLCAPAARDLFLGSFRYPYLTLNFSHRQLWAINISNQCHVVSREVTAMVPNLNVKSVASASNMSACSIAIDEITRHTKNTSVHIAIKDSMIRSIWRDMFELTLVCCQKITKNHHKYFKTLSIFSFFS